ncbi:hypothetical protein M422DRAFT_251795 [Sphaerobolus stellatus SS14]|uniref:Uncharacterized protein n=1 Tax=Sphaerobolus stellatus (strain SS14) TaxID=990650 RepID=A0A0C9W074_SPHS4|nr:hypothetical protein M422DRAFT_251795 [Sphaerobolus stellatus SS14]
MSGTKQYVACTSPRLVELGKPNLNVAKEHVMREGMHLAQILAEQKACDEHYEARNASRQTSCESSLEPEKAPSASRDHGRGTTPKSNCTLVRSILTSQKPWDFNLTSDLRCQGHLGAMWMLIG